MIKKSLVILPGVVLALTACAPDAPGPAGVVIVNARVIDGSGGPSRDVSVRVVGDRIATVGDFEPSAEDTLVDANGLVLAPGFIDVHSHHEDGLLLFRTGRKRENFNYRSHNTVPKSNHKIWIFERRGKDNSWNAHVCSVER